MAPSRTKNTPSNKTTGLVQTTILLPTLKKLDRLAKAAGHKRAGYVRYLIEMHVRALNPRLLLAIQRPRARGTTP